MILQIANIKNHGDIRHLRCPICCVPSGPYGDEGFLHMTFSISSSCKLQPRVDVCITAWSCIQTSAPNNTFVFLPRCGFRQEMPHTGSTTNPQWGCVRNCLQHNMRPGVCILVQSCSVPLACRRINMWQTRSHITDQTRGLHRVSGLLLGLSIFAALNWHVHFGTSRAMRGKCMANLSALLVLPSVTIGSIPDPSESK